MIHSETLVRLGLCAALSAMLCGCAASDVDEPSTKLGDLLITPAKAPAACWPGFRGGHHHGVNLEAEAPIAVSGPDAALWAAQTPGRGNSSPVIWGDLVWLTTRHEDAVQLLCLDRADGSLRWRRELAAVGPPRHWKNGSASATPVVDGERVYVAVDGRELLAVDLDGTIVWRRNLPHAKQRWGAASSPLLVGDRVIQLCDGLDGGCLLAFHGPTGELIWRTQRESTGCWSTPVVVAAETESGDSRLEVIVNGTGSAFGREGDLIAYDPFSGDELWRVPGVSDIACPTPIVGGGLVVSSSGANGPIFAVRPGHDRKSSAEAVLWRLPSGGPQTPTGVVVDERLFTISDGGVLVCREVQSGKTLWRDRLRGAFSASLVSDGRVLYAASEQGNLFIVAVDSDGFDLLADAALREPILATPAIVERSAFVRTASHLYRFDARDVEPSPSDLPVGGGAVSLDVEFGGPFTSAGGADEQVQ